MKRPNPRGRSVVARLVRLIEAEGITVHLTKQEWESQSSCWFVSSQWIAVGLRNNPPVWVVACLAHELGHCLSVRKGSLTTMGVYLRHKLKASLTAREKKGVLSEERRAWRLGFAFLRRHGFKVTDEMREMRKVLFGTHL